ncbi:hypothetical protein EDD11_009556 [Mortierella claussenii]|nr:hypothetical protein EDD11_009556 [Mortierella claussenii]
MSLMKLATNFRAKFINAHQLLIYADDCASLAALGYLIMTKTGALHHILLAVSDYELSKKFYHFLLVELMGYKNIMDEPYCNMWSFESGCSICITPGNKTPHNKNNPGLHHLALNIATHELVDEFYDKIVQFQEANKDHMSASVVLDKPALYPQYRPGYYAVFFTDPDGIKLELAFTPPR